MPSKVRIISKKNDALFDRLVEDLIGEEGFEVERTYFGITTEERAREVRVKLKTAANRHLRVGLKAFWVGCEGCPEGGEDCRYHVKFTAYDIAKAGAYMERKSKYAGS